MTKIYANCEVERGLPFLSYSYIWKTATGRDDECGAGSSEQRLKGNNLNTPVAGIKLCTQAECICKKHKRKKRKGCDLFKYRLRLESAQTVAAALKHAFFYHSKINADSGVLSPSALSPTVGRKEKKTYKKKTSTDLSRIWWNVNGRLTLMLQQSCSAAFSCIHHKNICSIYTLTTPLCVGECACVCVCVCVSAHT